MGNERSYTALFIIVPEKEDAVEEVKNSISSVLADNSGKIDKENMMGKKTLAYPIKKRTEGIYYEVSFKALPENIAKMTKQFNINSDLLRALIDKAE